MGSKEYYIVPVYTVIVDDVVCGDFDFDLLNHIIVSKTKNGYEELDGFNNFIIVKSERDETKELSIKNYCDCLYLNEDDIKEENRVEYYTFNEDEKLRCYRKLNEKIKMRYYQKDNFNNFINIKRGKVKVFGGK